MLVVGFSRTYLKTSKFVLPIIERVRYTMANCGKKWGDVGQNGSRTLISQVRMGQCEQLFYN